MNKKDCENIGLILAASNAPRFILEDFFRLDNRIKEEFNDFYVLRLKLKWIEDRHDAIMKENLGKDWSLHKDLGKYTSKAWRQAEKEALEIEFVSDLDTEGMYDEGGM